MGGGGHLLGEARPGDVIRDSSPLAERYPLVGPDDSTPLEEDEPEGTVPPCPLWAMKLRRHIHGPLPLHERHQRVRDKVGDGDNTVYVIDDGAHHVMGWGVGSVRSRARCEYCLYRAAQPRKVYDDLRNRALRGHRGAAFDGVVRADPVRRGPNVDSRGILSVDRVSTFRPHADAADIPRRSTAPALLSISFQQDLDINVD